MTDHLNQFLDKIHLIEKKTNNNEACIVTKLFHHQIRPEKSIDKILITKKIKKLPSYCTAFSQALYLTSLLFRDSEDK